MGEGKDEGEDDVVRGRYKGTKGVRTLHFLPRTFHNSPFNVDEYQHPSSHELCNFHPSVAIHHTKGDEGAHGCVVVLLRRR